MCVPSQFASHVRWHLLVPTVTSTYAEIIPADGNRVGIVFGDGESDIYWLWFGNPQSTANVGLLSGPNGALYAGAPWTYVRYGQMIQLPVFMRGNTGTTTIRIAIATVPHEIMELMRGLSKTAKE